MHFINHHVPIKLTANSKLCELNSERDSHMFSLPNLKAKLATGIL